MKRKTLPARAKKTFLISTILLACVYGLALLMQVAFGDPIPANPSYNNVGRMVFGAMNLIPYLLVGILLIRCITNYANARHYRAVFGNALMLLVVHAGLYIALVLFTIKLGHFHG